MLKPLKRLMLVAVITDFNMCKSSDIRWQRPQKRLVIEHFFLFRLHTANRLIYKITGEMTKGCIKKGDKNEARPHSLSAAGQIHATKA